jgi:modulator of FtsH protease HflK
MYLDMMQSVLGNTSKVLIDQKAGTSNLLYLPFDQLLKQSLPGASASANAPAMVDPTHPALPAPEAAATVDSSRSLSRDRGTSR